MMIQPEGLFIDNLNPSSVKNAENVDLTKLLMDILGTSLIPDIHNAQNCDNKELHYEELAKGKYERTRVCLTTKTTDLKSFVLPAIKNNFEENHDLLTRDISPHTKGNSSFKSLTHAVCNSMTFLAC